MTYLLIATPLSIYGYDTDVGKLETIRCGDGEYYGISWDEKSIYYSSSNIDSANIKTEEDYRKADVSKIYAFSETNSSMLIEHLIQPHQITVDSRGYLILTNTGFNNIIVINPQTKQKQTIFLGDADYDVQGTKKVGHHFNSIWEGDQSYYILAHNNNRKSAVYEIDKNTYELIKIHHTNARWAHNIWICEWGMVICNSKEGNLYEVESGEVIWLPDQNSIMTRGIAANQDYIFVGISQFGNRFTRRYSEGGFYIIDRKTLKTIDLIKLPQTGAINEIRILGSQDSAHPVPVINKSSINWLRNASLINTMYRDLSCTKYRYIDLKNKILNKSKQKVKSIFWKNSPEKI